LLTPPLPTGVPARAGVHQPGQPYGLAAHAAAAHQLAHALPPRAAHRARRRGW
jgi:hypothetical protein